MTAPASSSVALAPFPCLAAPAPSAWRDGARWNASSPLWHSSSVFPCFDVSSMRHHSSAEMLIIPLGSFLLFVMDFSLLYNIHFSS